MAAFAYNSFTLSVSFIDATLFVGGRNILLSALSGNLFVRVSVFCWISFSAITSTERAVQPVFFVFSSSNSTKSPTVGRGE
jgi:hypothetical protein